MQASIQGLPLLAEYMAQNQYQTLLTFYEPDSALQPLSPLFASLFWQQYLEPLHYEGIRLGAPAVTMTPGGIQWLGSFFGNCTHCHVDFLTYHWSGTSANEALTYLAQLFYNWPLPVWIIGVTLSPL